MKFVRHTSEAGRELWFASMDADEARSLCELALLGATLPEELQFLSSWEYPFLLEVAVAIGRSTLEAEVRARLGVTP